tara:strand:- start:3861 stop:4814 length:954 start_codon:yes stop_codon:yes gene_type:complete
MGNENEEVTIVSTDEAILDSIGENDEPTTDEDAKAPETAEGEAPTTSDQQSAEGGDDSQQKEVGGPQDLVDGRGNLVAQGGKERRFYETAQRERSRADNLEKELTTIKAQMDAVNNAGTLGTQYNLTPEEITTGAQIIAAYKNNPVETIQYMLTQAQASGHNIDALTTGGLDMSAVKQMLDTALQPLVSEHQERADTQAAQSRATSVYNNFMAKYPDSAVHEDTLARLLNEDTSLSPEAAYFKLQSYYARNNLDWTKSLAQLQQAATVAATSAENTQQALPEGSIANANVTDKPQVADVNTSTDDIIRDAMAEAGIN